MQLLKRLDGKLAALAFPYGRSHSSGFKDCPSPDTVYIAHQALWALGATTHIVDVLACQNAICAGKGFDFVLELSGFGENCALDGLLGTICAAKNISYFPSNQLARTIAADKLISKRFAKRAGLAIPDTISTMDVAQRNSSQVFLCKPICGGESLGIRKISGKELEQVDLADSFVEEYVSGIDVTVLAVRNPYTRQNELIAAYANTDSSEEDITTNTTKKKDHHIFGASIRTRQPILREIDSATVASVMEYLEIIGCPPICRIDFRRSYTSGQLYFLEANIDPTLGANQLWYEPIKEWSNNIGVSSEFAKLDTLPLHNSAKVMALLIGINHM